MTRNPGFKVMVLFKGEYYSINTSAFYIVQLQTTKPPVHDDVDARFLGDS